MRTPRRDKQKMYYSLFNGATPIYEKDENGNIVYIEVDGEQTPVQVGETKVSYSTPVEFKASISSSLNEMHCASYGVDASSIYQRIVTEKNYIPLEVGAVVWRANEIQWDDEEHTIPKASSADYTVVGLMKESLTEDWYLLKCNSSE